MSMRRKRSSNKEILEMYYKCSCEYVNLADIKRLLHVGNGKASTIRNELQAEALEKDEVYPTGYVPIDKVLEKVGINIKKVERNYRKEISLGL